MDAKILRIGHSPDPDDAFMWFPLVPDQKGRALVDTGEYRFEHILEDIQSLNQRAEKRELEITALSIHQYPYVAKDYVLTSCGSSMGDGYGPMVVARPGVVKAQTMAEMKAKLCEKGMKIAIPGERTTAFLALSLLLGKGCFEYEAVAFDEIPQAVAQGKYGAGLLIHEGQLTYMKEGLELVVDLGKWWKQTRGLVLPLGGNAIRRDLGAVRMKEICGILLKSIEFALKNREAALEHALKFARGMDAGLADRFVGMYVNQWTLDYGPAGRQAIVKLLQSGFEAGICPDAGEIDFVSPAGT